MFAANDHRHFRISKVGGRSLRKLKIYGEFVNDPKALLEACASHFEELAMSGYDDSPVWKKWSVSQQSPHE